MKKKYKIFILYEKLKSEFYGKILLYMYLKKNYYDSIEFVKLGFYKILIPEILSLQENQREDVIIIYKDIWKSSESLINIFKILGFKYYTFHEEEILLYSIKKPENIKKNFIDNNHLSKIDGFFCLGNKSKNIYKKFYDRKNKKIFSKNNLKYTFLEQILSKTKKNSKQILITNGESIFIHFKDYYNVLKNMKLYKNHEISKSLYSEGYDGKFDNFNFYKSSKKYLRFILKLCKYNKEVKFIFRIHPGEESYISKYKKIFKKIKNISFDRNILSFDSISNSSGVICPPSTIALEAYFLNKPFKIFYDDTDESQRYCFDKHISLNLFYYNKFKNITNITNVNSNKNLNLSNYFNNSFKTCKIISEVIFKNTKKNKNKNQFIFFPFNYFLNKIMKDINFNKKKNFYSVKYYKKFYIKYKYSLTRLFFSMLFSDMKNSKDFIFKIYKYCLARNIENTPYEWDKGINDQIDEKSVRFYVKLVQKKLSLDHIDIKIQKNSIIFK